MQPLHKRKKTVWMWGTMIVLIIFFLWNPLQVGQHVKGVAHSAFGPFFQYTSQLGLGIARTVDAIIHLPRVGRDLEVAQDDIFILTSQLAQQEDVVRENAYLRKLVNLPLIVEEDNLAADVIMRDFMSGNWILINRGSRDHVRVGDLAIGEEGILIGEVYEVTPQSAYVRLSTDEDSIFRVVKAGTTHSAVAQGSHGTMLRVEHIDTDIEVKVGDVFLYSNAHSVDIAARRLSVGIVQDVTMTEDRLSQTARLVPLYDANTLTHLFILQQE